MYTAAAHKAALVAEQQADRLPCQIPANNLLYCFLLEARNVRLEQPDHDSDRVDNLTRHMKTAADALAVHGTRVYDYDTALEVKCIGPILAKIIRDELFEHYPPEPPTEAELAQLQASKAAQRAAAAAARKRRAEAAAAAAPPPASAERRASLRASPPYGAAGAMGAAAAAARGPRSGGACFPQSYGFDPDLNSGGFPDEGVIDDWHEDDHRMEDRPQRGARGRGRGCASSRGRGAAGSSPRDASGSGGGTKTTNRRSTKPYCPGIGTANYAFLICLLQAQRGPEQMDCLSKEELIARTEASGLSDKSITASAAPAPNYRRGGGSGSGAPFNARQFYSGWSSFGTLKSKGLVAAYSNPVKIKLTLEGLVLAEQLYRDAVARGKVVAVPGLPVTGPPLFQVDAPLEGVAAAVAAGATQAAAGLRADALPSAALRPPSRQAGPAAGAAGAAALRRAAEFAAIASSPLPPLPQQQQQPRQQQQQRDDPLDVPLAQRLGAYGGNGGAPQAPRDTSAPLFLDLAGPSSDEEELQAPRPRHPAACRVSDEHVAMMVEMGFSDKKARRALHQSGGIEDALEIATALSSGDEGGTSDEEEITIQNRDHLAALPPRGLGAAFPAVPPPRSRQGSEEPSGARGHVRGAPAPPPRPVLGSQSQPQTQDLLIDAAAALLGNGNGNGNRRGPSAPASRRASLSGAAPADPLARAGVRLPPLPPGVRFSEVYDIVLLVDGREQFARTGGPTSSRGADLTMHLTRMRSAGLAVEQRTLPVGDAIWVARARTGSIHGSTAGTEYVLDYVLERKSLADLLSSIRDSNRYESQKYALARCGLRHVYYLIEGDAQALAEVKDAKTVKTAAAKTEILDGFRVLRTRDVGETFRLYRALTEALTGMLSTAVAPSGSTSAAALGARALPFGQTSSVLGNAAERPPSFEELKAVVAEATKGATTLHDVWACMLCECPGLGQDAVQAVLEAYPTPKSLFCAYRSALAAGAGGGAAAELLVADLRAPGGRRAVGLERSRKLFQHLFGGGWALAGRG